MRLHALVAVCLLAWAAPAQTQNVPALERGRSLMAEGRLWPAEQAAREAIQASPDSAAAHQLLGRVLKRRNQGANALPEFERAHTLDPSLPGIDRDLGIARFDQSDRAGAREPLRRAVKSEPDDAALRIRLGLCELEAERPGEAARLFERASDDPLMGQLALYNLGLARLDEGRRQDARSAFERAVARGPDTVAGGAAASALDAMEAPTLVRAQNEKSGPRPYRLELGAGLLYDDNVVVEEIDDVSNSGDGGGVFELSSGIDLPVGDLFESSLGYDFYQTVYFESTEVDLQSHTFSASGTRPVGDLDATLGYTFSLSTLDSDRFLDFHELRTSLGWAPSASWFLSPSAALRVKRFGRGRDEDRDAEQGAIGLLQLFAVGSWERYVTLGAQVEVEDADGAEFDYWGPVATLSLRTPVPLPFSDKPPRFDARYRFRWRDYTNEDDRIGKQRRDYINQLRVRLDVPLVADFSLRTQYEFEDSDSNLSSADYTSNRVDVLLRYEL